ncbi:hypothetical protein L228DRAFT_229679 [Xylona heveae TC161]|uniref:RING-type domain-containing protein n=1 Tax=Xylona heveae (strain CBS 132557 / TC161) TaxID=1328760 RepID=A0A165GSI3_XYLHT|nr:hypothetical protein L228DRAFT_229679 [Xylona heveae TC161]KZF22540.1 hypothetical protein L228DRAFT_229679 [Xylona heveae TC161]
MALDPSSGYVAASNLQDLGEVSLPIFNVERVPFQFAISSDFVAAQVANNVLVLALSTGRILRIDLDHAEDVDDIDLPKRSSEIGIIRRMFLDPTASHLIISTTLGENFYLHTQSRQPKALSRLKGTLESVAWNPSEPTASTREILVGTTDGNIYEVYIEPSTEFYRREEKYLKAVYKTTEGPVTGLWVQSVDGKPDLRRVLVATPESISHFIGRIGRHGHEGGGSVFTRLFETETPTRHDISRVGDAPLAKLVISPEPVDDGGADVFNSDRVFAWLSSQGVFYGKLSDGSSAPGSRSNVFQDSKLLPRSQLPASESNGGRRKASAEPIASIALTQWHILNLIEGRVVAVNRLDESTVYDQVMLEAGQSIIGVEADLKKNTFWVFTNREIFEVVVTDEDRDVWKVMLKDQQFDAALHYARTTAQKDAVATASGDYLVSRGKFMEAAGIYGKSNKPFEEVALIFIDHGEQDSLRKYLLTKLSGFKKSSIMQRVMVASWLVEVFMSKLNALDDTITTKAELSENTNTAETKTQLSQLRTEFQEFVTKYKSDLDRKTAYDIISSHGREEELLFYASTVNDYNYVLAYWVQREKWAEALTVLKKQTDPDIFYKYSSVLMKNASVEFIDILMRQNNLDPRKLIPALLNYNKDVKVSINQNQAIRYLLFVINQHRSTDSAVHNTLISIYASHPSRDESALLSYLESQSQQHERRYDADFALRLCIEHKRVQSCVHIYSSMGQYLQAVELALNHGEIDLASVVADQPDTNPALRKKLWLAVAKKVISQSDGIKTAIEFLKRCELLRIEDLIPFFPDFVVIDDFKEEICTALEDYSRHIDILRKEMDESASTASNIKADIRALDRRYAIVEPGEKCYICQYPLLTRQFFVFPCQHAFHSDCLAKRVVDLSGVSKGRRVRELQAEVSRGVAGPKRERAMKELENHIASACILCSEYAIKLIDEPFITPADDRNEWAL